MGESTPPMDFLIVARASATVDAFEGQVYMMELVNNEGNFSLGIELSLEEFVQVSQFLGDNTPGMKGAEEDAEETRGPVRIIAGAAPHTQEGVKK